MYARYLNFYGSLIKISYVKKSCTFCIKIAIHLMQFLSSMTNSMSNHNLGLFFLIYQFSFVRWVTAEAKTPQSIEKSDRLMPTPFQQGKLTCKIVGVRFQWSANSPCAHARPLINQHRTQLYGTEVLRWQEKRHYKYGVVKLGADNAGRRASKAFCSSRAAHSATRPLSQINFNDLIRCVQAAATTEQKIAGAARAAEAFLISAPRSHSICIKKPPPCVWRHTPDLNSIKRVGQSAHYWQLHVYLNVGGRPPRSGLRRQKRAENRVANWPQLKVALTP